MKKFLQKKLNDKGLTLVELLAVIVILGIIAAIAVPAIGNIINNSKVNALFSDGQNAISAGSIYFAESTATGEGSSSITIKDLKEKGFLEDAGGLVDGATVQSVKKEGNVVTVVDGEAENGKISVQFNQATNKDITAADSKDGNGQIVTVTR